MAYLPNRGDIVHLDFDPASGKEINGPHFGLVLSGKQFNQHGLAMICPISQGVAAAARTYGTVVTLMGSGTDTQGAVHCHQRHRAAEFGGIRAAPGRLEDQRHFACADAFGA